MVKQEKSSDASPTIKKTLSSAWKSPLIVIIFIAITSAALVADLFSKSYVFDSILNDQSIPARIAKVRAYAKYKGHDLSSNDYLRRLNLSRPLFARVNLTLSANPGIVFGWDMPRMIVAIASVITIAIVCGMFLVSDKRAWITHLGLALILAGAIGNLYDRIFSSVKLPGLDPIQCHVRDFIDCSEWGYRYVFNVADVWLVVGVGMFAIQLIVQFVKERKLPAKSETSAPEKS